MVDWNKWEECANGVRTRAQYIAVQPKGAVPPCPDSDGIETEGF